MTHSISDLKWIIQLVQISNIYMNAGFSMGLIETNFSFSHLWNNYMHCQICFRQNKICKKSGISVYHLATFIEYQNVMLFWNPKKK